MASVASPADRTAPAEEGRTAPADAGLKGRLRVPLPAFVESKDTRSPSLLLFTSRPDRRADFCRELTAATVVPTITSE